MFCKFIKFLYILLFGFYASAACSVPNFAIEPVSIEKIDNLTQKYCQDYKHKKNVKVMIWSAITVSVVGGVGLLVWDGWIRDKKVVGDKDSKFKIDELKFEEWEKKRGMLGKFRTIILTSLITAACGGIMKVLGEAFSITSVGISSILFSNALTDVKLYRDRQEKIKEYMLKLARIRELIEQQKSDDDSETTIDMLGILTTDLIGSHRILANFFQELLAFTKFWTIMNFGEKSIQYVAINSECAALCDDFNIVTEKMSKIINKDEHAPDLHNFYQIYGLFGKRLTKFIYDCGLSFYGNNFLQQ